MISPYYCPAIHPVILQQRLNIGKMHFTDLGLEKCCSTCKESFPADTEFFSAKADSLDGLNSMCKACQNGRRGR